MVHPSVNNDPDGCHRKSYGGLGEREIPGPIPNPEVKPLSADGTAWETVWESRTSPDNLYARGRSFGSGLAAFTLKL